MSDERSPEARQAGEHDVDPRKATEIMEPHNAVLQFMSACKSNDLESVQRLLREAAAAIAPELGAALLTACRGGHVDVVREILAAPAQPSFDIHTTDALLCEAADAGHVAVMHALLGLSEKLAPDPSSNDSEVLCIAAASWQPAMVQCLLDVPGARAVDVHCQGERPLREAVASGCVHTALLLQQQQQPPRAADMLVYLQGQQQQDGFLDAAGVSPVLPLLRLGGALPPSGAAASVLRHTVIGHLQAGVLQGTTPGMHDLQSEGTALWAAVQEWNTGEADDWPMIAGVASGVLSWLVRCACVPELGGFAVRAALVQTARAPGAVSAVRVMLQQVLHATWRGVHADVPAGWRGALAAGAARRLGRRSLVLHRAAA